MEADRKAGSLIRVEYRGDGPVQVHLSGTELAGRAVATLAESVRALAERHGIGLEQLRAIIVHGGNGRLPALLARRLGLPAERVWSETARTGNLGSASLPVAWAAHKSRPAGPIAWAAIGAGITWGVALTKSAH